jgi:hypothetical protein
MRAGRALIAATLLTVANAGCGPAEPSASPPGGVAAGVNIIGCISIEQAECELVADRVRAELPPERGAPFSIQVQLFGCPDANPRCPRSLIARDGMVTAEYADRGEPINMTIEGPPAAPRLGPALFTWAGLQQPSSPRAPGPGPFPFEVGHCGLTWQVDFDGSFWLPIGQVDGDASVVINGEAGRMRLVRPDLAEYRNDEGFLAQLARFPGPKHIWGCM